MQHILVWLILTLTPCISHRLCLYTKPFPLAQILLITDKLLQNKFIIFSHFLSHFDIVDMIMEAPINLFLQRSSNLKKLAMPKGKESRRKERKTKAS